MVQIYLFAIYKRGIYMNSWYRFICLQYTNVEYIRIHGSDLSVCNIQTWNIYEFMVQIYLFALKALKYTFESERMLINPLNPELNPICCLLALLGANHFLHLSRIKVKSLTLRLLMSYIYMEHPFLMFLDHTQRRSTVGRTPLDE